VSSQQVEEASAVQVKQEAGALALAVTRQESAAKKSKEEEVQEQEASSLV
jgi:hypothetical protein